ncbi:hypothetical protein SAMN04488034_10869 [Salinimicrobium catena]|uniref:40-residue YVTN family beta-propeller repeat-containing protein n=1 Tax=Salinimicrobium catena TaxID=390640 RepID=A0A1H5P5N2_9FLAO|nr:quinoprotein amine dehydrogenase [Salinimicrobium catena]SDL67344.1 hypothetical protein SAMN04488140_10827 [Salinimicrobium catena]SEF08361.1 hypothetical protein SAMN04488034_10869 [Salinimicrobium catena]
MMRIIKLLLVVFAAFLFNSCNKDDDTVLEQPSPAGDYVDGIFVLNEGSQSAGTVTFIRSGLQSAEQEIYAAVNDGDDLGNYAQSIFFTEELAFIISGGSNLITVVDRYTFELAGKIDSGLAAPRYGVAVGGKAYVTNQAAWDSSDDDYIAVIDIESLTVEETVIAGSVVEDIIEGNGLLYVQNAAYGSGNQISIFNPSNNTIEGTITTGDGLNSIDIENNMLYALSSGRLESFDLSTHNSISEITSEGLTGAQNLNVENGKIYYTINNGVYFIEATATEPAASPLIEYHSNSDYGVMYGFEVKDEHIFIADGGDFASNSFVQVFTTGGELLETIEVGVGPNGFYFND